MTHFNREADCHLTRRQKAKLVVICRDPLDCDRIREWLALSGTVEVVADALSVPEAVGAIGRHSPDLLLIDLRLMSQATVRRLAYSSARPLIIFLNSSAEPCAWDGTNRAVTVTLQDQRLFRRQIELTAELRLVAGTLVTNARLLELLTNRSFRRKPRVESASNSVLDPEQISWLEGNSSTTMVYGNQLRVVHLSLAAILDDFRRRRAKFALVSDTIAVNLNRVEAAHVDRGGSGTVVLDGGLRIGIDRARLHAIFRRLQRRRPALGAAPRSAPALRRAVRDEHSHL